MQGTAFHTPAAGATATATATERAIADATATATGRKLRTSPTVHGLSAETLRTTASRLGMAALFYSLFYMVVWGATALLVAITTDPEEVVAMMAQWTPRPVVDRFLEMRFMFGLTSLLNILSGIALFVVVRRTELSASTTIWLALGFTVWSCMGISLAENWFPPPPFNNGISWVCLWLCIFPLLVPMPPRRALVASLIAATTGPLSHLLGSAVIGYSLDARYMMWSFMPTYIAAGTAWVASRFIYRLSRDADKAKQMGSYRLVERIGQGGMGEVWRAEHKLLARPAAVKLIRPERDTGDPNQVMTVLKRFEREAQATAKLTSQHTVQLYDYGISDNGDFFYVMELLDGIDLETLVSVHGAQPPERVARILTQACQSLAEAHSQDMLHRDIKPANIFLCRRGIELDCVKVLDFGLVKSIHHAEKFDSQLTADGMTSGTPAYMSPEAAQDPDSADHRSDIYALGCVAYWLLTGSMVFEHSNAIKLLIAHVREQPARPSE
ncbi:MAG: serine/threonine-protein kinase, partial [Myxococcota bacterium]